MRITNPTLIDGRDAAKMSDADLIEAIRHEEELAKSLSKMDAATTSKKIAIIIKRHNDNAKKLIKLLDIRK